MIKNIVIAFLCLIVFNSVEAKPINAAAYRTMQAQSYRANYNRQVRNRPMPYWQAQSNFSTRNRVYSNYYDSLRNYNYQRNYTRRRY